MSDTFTEGHLERARNFLDHAGVPAGTVDTDLAQLLATIEQEARHAPGANNPPSPIDPERLIDVAALPGLMATNYIPLFSRKEELTTEAEKWRATHLVPPPANHPEGKPWPEQYRIKGDADNDDASDHYRFIQAYAGPKGEVEDVRKAVKLAPWEACKEIDRIFGLLRNPFEAHLETVTEAQNRFIREKAEVARIERDRLAEIERQAAADALAAASAPTAGEAEMQAAFRAEERAAETAARAAEPVRELVRSTSALGTTTTAKGTWSWELDGDDGLLTLIKAVAEGKAPITFLTTNDTIINASVRAKNLPTRKCPGLLISQTFGVARSAR